MIFFRIVFETDRNTNEIRFFKAIGYIPNLVVIGSKSATSEPNGMTATWAFQVSFEPRVFAVTIQEDAHTRQNIEATGVFSVSIQPEGAHDLSLT